jgi:hypothetical protein
VQKLWIGYIVIPDLIEEKLRTKHMITGAQLRAAISQGAHDEASVEDHPQYGERLLVTGSTLETGPVIAYLRPIDESDGTWECLTARRFENG